MMSKDTIVDEVRRSREKIAARHDFNIDSIFAEAKMNQKQKIKPSKPHAA